ncbi:hypothetical protein GE278_23665 (plasmid) [Enterobacteriaceae bacterium Kacie_13]|nr:hypothetical protein GE278_23665 [Enterobacteriaceae bacterium Kacie_13]
MPIVKLIALLLFLTGTCRAGCIADVPEATVSVPTITLHATWNGSKYTERDLLPKIDIPPIKVTCSSGAGKGFVYTRGNLVATASDLQISAAAAAVRANLRVAEGHYNIPLSVGPASLSSEQVFYTTLTITGIDWETTSTGGGGKPRSWGSYEYENIITIASVDTPAENALYVRWGGTLVNSVEPCVALSESIDLGTVIGNSVPFGGTAPTDASSFSAVSCDFAYNNLVTVTIDTAVAELEGTVARGDKKQGVGVKLLLDRTSGEGLTFGKPYRPSQLGSLTPVWARYDAEVMADSFGAVVTVTTQHE